jgi:hypothetical protein
MTYMSSDVGLRTGNTPDAPRSRGTRRGSLRLPVNGEEVTVPSALHLSCPKCHEVVLRSQEYGGSERTAIAIYRRKARPAADRSEPRHPRAVRGDSGGVRAPSPYLARTRSPTGKSGNFFSDSVSILLGNGTGGFSAATNLTAGIQPSTVAVADFNADGASDLAVANRGSNDVSILLGDGTGAFSRPGCGSPDRKSASR